MLKTKYDVLSRDGKELFVMVPVSDYQEMLERLEDQDDLHAIDEAKIRNACRPMIPHERVMRDYGLKSEPVKETF